MHPEHHRTNRIGWLRAAVLGANDGLLSTSSLVLGVAAASGSQASVFIAGAAGLVAGAMSMAAGEYVSVSSQADSEAADLARERLELTQNPEAERQELADIYVGRGLSPALADEVATQLMQHNALEAHARDELGISETFSARPTQAALASAASFAVGGFVPVIVASLSPKALLVPAVAVTAVVCLVILGSLAAKAGGADARKGALRVVFWGIVAMLVTFGVGRFFGTKV